jgi:hypothetical protein
MNFHPWVVRLVALLFVLTVSGAARADPEVGWWWNASESGRGFFIESQGGIFYLAGYFYESDGRATWAVSGSPNADANSYDGRLLAYRGGQTLWGDYKPPEAPTDIGAVSVRFSDATHGTVTWPGGAIAIEREIFGTGPAQFQPLSGWWWNGSESGRGYSVEVQGNNLFLVAFMYDDAGNPVWYFSAGPMSDPTHYEGEWLQFANGQTMTGAYHPPSAPVVVGHLIVDFNAADEADFTFVDDVLAKAGASPKKGRTKIVTVTREFKSKPTYTFPKRYDGEIKYIETYSFLGEKKVTATVKLTLLPSLPPEWYLTSFPGKEHEVYMATNIVNAKAVHVDVVRNDDDGCKASGSQSFELPPNDIVIEVSAYSGFTGYIAMTPVELNYDGTCPNGTGGTYPVSFHEAFSIAMRFRGAIRYGIHGDWKNPANDSELKQTGRYDFAEVNQ